MLNTFRVLFLFVFLTGNSLAQTSAPARPVLLVGLDFGFSYSMINTLEPDYIKLRDFGGRVAPSIGYFITANLVAGVRYESSFATSNYTSYMPILGLGGYIRQYIPRINIQKDFRWRKNGHQRTLLIRPITEIYATWLNAYYESDDKLIRRRSFFAPEVNWSLGASIRLKGSFYFNLRSGLYYAFNEKQMGYRPAGGIEYYFSK